MDITLRINPKGIAATLITAVEQGIHYWARNVGYEEKIPSSAREMAKETDYPAWAFAPVLGKGDTFFISIDEYDETVEHGYDEDGEWDPNVGLIKRHRLDANAIKRGLEAMAADYGLARLLGDVMTGYADAEGADVFVQCCLFGKVVYG